VITLSGYNGAIVRWEISTDGGYTWLYVDNSSATQTFLNLKETTMYRAVVANEIAAPAYSSATTITVNPAPPVLPTSRILFPSDGATVARRSQLVAWGTCDAGQPFAYLTLARTTGTGTRALLRDRRVASVANFNWSLNLKAFIAVPGTYELKIASQPDAPVPAQTIQFTVE
jgi:hypothetical protein